MSELAEMIDAFVQGARRAGLEVVTEIKSAQARSEDAEGAFHAMRGRAEAAERELAAERHKFARLKEAQLIGFRRSNDLSAELDTIRHTLQSFSNEFTVDAVKRVVAERDRLLACAVEDAKVNDSHRESWQKAVRDKNATYAERNQCVALIAKMAIALGWTPTGIGEHVDVPGEPEWESDWRTLLFVQLPTGQATWHFHDSERGLLDGMPMVDTKWDGHSTEEKYRRVNTVTTKNFPSVDFQRDGESFVEAAKRDILLAETEVGDLRVVIRELESDRNEYRDKFNALSKQIDHGRESSDLRAKVAERDLREAKNIIDQQKQELAEARTVIKSFNGRIDALVKERDDARLDFVKLRDACGEPIEYVSWAELRDVLAEALGTTGGLYAVVKERAERV